MRPSPGAITVAALLLPMLAAAGETPTSPAPVRPAVPATPAPPAKPPPPAELPDEAAREAALKELRSLYKAEFASRRPEDRLALARKLHEQGQLPGPPAMRHAMLAEAAETAAKAGDPLLLQEVLAVHGTVFRIDHAAESLRLLPVAGQNASTLEQALAAINALANLADAAASRDDYAAAVKAIGQAEQAAKRTRDANLVGQIRAQGEEIRRCAEAWEEVGDVEDPLGGISPTGHGRLGRFHALVKRDWVRALPHFAQSDLPAFKQAADAETAATEPAGRIAAGDAWLALAGKERAQAKQELTAHAAMLYRQALDGLAGIERARLDKRLAELERQLGGPRLPPRCPPGPAVYYGFERDGLSLEGGRLVALDAGGRGVRGRGTGVRPAGGPWGGALEFGPGATSLELGSPRDLAITGSLTISMWLMPYQLTLRRNPFCKSYGGEGAITIEAGGALTYFWGANTSDIEPYQGFGSGSGILVERKWSHITLVRDLSPARRLYWYFDGRRVHEAAASYPQGGATPNPTMIGLGYTAVPYVGLLDELAVWPRALGEAEVRQLYEATAGGR